VILIIKKVRRENFIGITIKPVQPSQVPNHIKPYSLTSIIFLLRVDWKDPFANALALTSGRNKLDWENLQNRNQEYIIILLTLSFFLKNLIIRCISINGELQS